MIVKNIVKNGRRGPFSVESTSDLNFNFNFIIYKNKLTTLIIKLNITGPPVSYRRCIHSFTHSIIYLYD